MKIAVNGEVIDTKDIYKISRIQECDEVYGKVFYIQLFNKIEIEVAITYPKFDYNGKTPSSQEEANALITEHRQKTIDKIEAFRQSIIDIWSDNQSDIPQFNL